MAEAHATVEHPDVRFDTSDVPYGVVLISLAVLAVLIGITMVAMWLVMNVVKEQTRTASNNPMAEGVRSAFVDRRKELRERADAAEREGKPFEAMELRREADALRRFPEEPLRKGAQPDVPWLEGMDITLNKDFQNKPRSGIMGWPSMAREQRDRDEQELSTAGYRDEKDKKGAHIPIDDAMRIMLEKNLLKPAPPSRP